MIRIRPATKADLKILIELANSLDSINLACNDTRLSRQIDVSTWSFAGELTDFSTARYIFVAEVPGDGPLATSMIIAKHGTPERPHLYFEENEDLLDDEALGNPVNIKYMVLRKDTDGPTELGGLVVDPKVRGMRLGIGKAISLIRFIYIKQHLDRFQDELIAEMKPRLLPDNESAFWNHFGREATGLKYREADMKSITDKGFIERLYNGKKYYRCLLPDDARRCIGKVGDDTRPAVAMLEKAGLKRLKQFDPLDGGLYLGGKIKDISIFKLIRSVTIRTIDFLPSDARKMLIGGHSLISGRWEGALVQGIIEQGRLVIPQELLSYTGFAERDEVGALVL